VAGIDRNRRPGWAGIRKWAREVVKEDVTAFDRGFDTRNQNDAPLLGIACEGGTVSDPIVVRETQDLIASLGSEVN